MAQIWNSIDFPRIDVTFSRFTTGAVIELPMTYADALNELETPLGRRFDGLSYPAWLKAVALFALLVLFYVAVLFTLTLPAFATLFRPPTPFWAEMDTVLFISVLCGYLYASEVYLNRGSLQDVLGLREHIPPDQRAPLDTTSIAPLTQYSRIAAWTGALVGVIYVLFFTGSGALFLTEGKVEAFLIFASVTFPAIFSRAGRAIILGNPALTLFRTIDAARFNVDIFDRDAYRPFVRMGMRAALRWLFMFAILVGFLLDENNNNTIFGSLPMIYIMVGASAFVATYEFLLPLATARALIMKDKAAERTWVITKIKERREDLKSMDTVETPRARLADLLAYKREIDHMPDWPVDSPDIGRFIIYLLIPFLSWFGAAGAEVMMEAYFNDGR